MSSRSGIGIDSHRLEPGRRLVLGGVDIPHEAGLAGHSDADVLAHAVIDALLGAAALGTIGEHFPDTDPRFAGVSSLVLLEETMRLKTTLLVTCMSLGGALVAAGAQAQSTSPLSGKVSSAEEGLMEGVLVSAKKEGSTITQTVVTNEKGEFSFPAGKLGAGLVSHTDGFPSLDRSERREIPCASRSRSMRCRWRRSSAIQMINAATMARAAA